MNARLREILQSYGIVTDEPKKPRDREFRSIAWISLGLSVCFALLMIPDHTRETVGWMVFAFPVSMLSFVAAAGERRRAGRKK